MFTVQGAKDLRREKVSQFEMLEVLAVFEQDPVCQGAFGLLSRLLFALGAEVATPGVSVKANLSRPDFRFYVKKYITRFLAQAFVHLLCFGFVVWTAVEKKIPGERMFWGRPVLLPVVVEPDLYEVHVVTKKDFSVEYELFSTRANGHFATSPDKRLHIALYPQKEPSPQNGKLRGLLSCTVNHNKMMAQMFEWLHRAEWQRTHPPYTV